MGGKQLRQFLVDGTPGGLTTAQIMSGTGHVLSGPHSGLEKRRAGSRKYCQWLTDQFEDRSYTREKN